jgi:hypothetical protein
MLGYTLAHTYFAEFALHFLVRGDGLHVLIACLIFILLGGLFLRIVRFCFGTLPSIINCLLEWN